MVVILLPMMTSALERAISEVGNQSKLAVSIGVKQAHVWYWLNKAKHVPAEHVIAIERATGGKVTRAELRPDLYGAADSYPAAEPLTPGVASDRVRATPAVPEPCLAGRTSL